MKRTLVEMYAVALCSLTLMCFIVSLTLWSEYGIALASDRSDSLSSHEIY